MVRLLPKDRKLRRWVIFILIITFIMVASLLIYSVVASTKHKPDNPTPPPHIYEDPVAFHVYSRGNYTEVNSTIRYENSYVNTGSMNLTTGVFLAPTDGTYVFNFIAPRYSNTTNDVLCLNVRLDRNGLPIGNGPICGDSYEEWTPTSFNAVLNLKLNDTVEMFLEQGAIKASKGSDPPRTHFTGFFLEGESAFHAFRTVESFASRKNETIPFYGLNTDIQSNFNVTTSTFTAPVNGTYFFQFSGSSSITTDVILVRNDDEPMGYGYTRNTHWGSAGFHTLWPLQKGDKVYARLNTGQLDEADRDLKITNFLCFIVSNVMSDSRNSPIHFHVIRTSSLYTGRPDGIGQLINYTRIITNEGEGMDVSTGIFKAPESGLYALHYTSHRGNSYIGPNACSTVIQKLNNETIGAGSNCHSTYSAPIFIHSVLLLQNNDEIKMLLYEGDINAVIDHQMCARFSGFLIYST
ncbi:uncharacterized protein LOC124203772 isoform X2 [Daphnia pulex]|uniref:uncharacterized protein LOC124203772 isoform X2 n=1 Tax=Daphnia pulex TaxID=6669 RepID=UPI001EDE98DE|nr:uncharacterized protein LOC124203772 isoform X2 [Daphnia pulex]